MAYDFAKRKRKRKKPRKQEVSSRPVWFGTGLACGLFVAWLLQLANVYFVSPQNDDAVAREQIREKSRTVATNNQARHKTPVVTAEKPAQKRARFEFYDELQKQDATVNQRSKDAYQTRSEANAAATSFLLQAGSFAAKRDAESRRAAITLLNLTAKVERGILANGVAAHRVFVGPYSNRSDMAKARAQLHEQGIETLLMAKR